MSWRQVTVLEWCCDGCGAEEVTHDDRDPDGWVRTVDERDLCRKCSDL